MARHAAGPRRSARNQLRSARYVDDPFDRLDAADLPPDLYAPDDNLSPPPPPDPADQDRDFSDSAGDEHASASSAASGSHESVHDASDPPSESTPPPPKRRPAAADHLSRDTSYTRRLQPQPKYSYKPYHILRSYPLSDPSRDAVLKAVHRWAVDTTLPSRTSDPDGLGGFLPSFHTARSSPELGQSTGWDWYYSHGGQHRFTQGTTCHPLTDAQAKPYLNPAPHSRHVLVGPPENQPLFPVLPCASVRLHQPDLHRVPSAKILDSLPNPNSHWLVNAGESVQCIDWAPVVSTTPAQYLALSTWPNHVAQNVSSFGHVHNAQTSIQIWEFSTSLLPGGGHQLTIDGLHPPSLRIVLCCDWGLIKQLKWCPVPREHHQTPPHDSDDLLGLLAAVFTDGAIRVFHVLLPNRSDKGTTYLRYTSTAFESLPPDTVCSCLTWISPSILAAGCANGHVAVWDLASHLDANSSPRNALPLLYQSFHSTIVTTIVSCQPSSPYHILTSSMDGLVRLTDLRHPTVDIAYPGKSRLGTIPLVWQDHLLHAFAADESQSLACHNVRRLFTTFRCCEMDASPICIAASPVHTCILMGTTDGSAICTNPARFLVGMRHIKQESHFRQKWFTHEWRRGGPHEGQAVACHSNESMNPQQQQAQSAASEKSQELDALPANHGPDSADFPHGLSRITTNYAPTPHALCPSWALDGSSGKNAEGGPKSKRSDPSWHNRYWNVRHGPSGIRYTTIHEEQAGVRCIAWNPNLQCGGVAAAGLASGLLVVGDLAIDK